MADLETTTVSEEGFASTNQVGDFELTIDATDEEGPNPNAVLVADYASCFLPAFRVAAQQQGHDDLGEIQIETEATLDDDDDLESIGFTIYVKADLDEETFDEIVDQAEEICHVHSALEADLQADVTVEGGAF